MPYPGQGSFTNLAIRGDVDLQGGSWIHPSNTGGDQAVDRLSVTVGNNFTLGELAKIDLYKRGFAAWRGPGASASSLRGGTVAYAPSHGGIGGFGDDATPVPTYGSAFRPTTLGSGGAGAGGGNLQLIVGGLSQIDGMIEADGHIQPENSNPGSGGSVLVQAAAFGGHGTISARGSSGYRSSGGGRIALIATQSTACPQGTLTLSTRAGASASIEGVTQGRPCGTPGTIFLKTSVSQRLVIDGENVIAQPGLHTPLPPPPDRSTDRLKDFRNLIVRLAHRAAVTPTCANIRIRDLEWVDADVDLFLNGYDLYVRTPYHPFSTSLEAEQQVVDRSAGGELIWVLPGTVLLLR